MTFTQFSLILFVVIFVFEVLVLLAPFIELLLWVIVGLVWFFSQLICSIFEGNDFVKYSNMYPLGIRPHQYLKPSPGWILYPEQPLSQLFGPEGPLCLSSVSPAACFFGSDPCASSYRKGHLHCSVKAWAVTVK